MNSKDIDFEFSEQIRRYLDEMISYWNECKLNMPTDRIQFAEPLEIQTYLEKEYGNESDENNLIKFIRTLEKENSIIYIHKPESTGHLVSKDKYIVYPETFYVHVRDIKPILWLYSLFNNDKTERDEDNGRFLFFNEGTGEFKSGKRKKIIEMDDRSKYYKVLIAIYLSSGGDGKTTVVKINEVLTRHFELKHKMGKREIQNCINSPIKKKLRETVPSSLEMFKWKRGSDEVTFNNPII